MYCGPAPLRQYHRHRFGASHRNYWDYDPDKEEIIGDEEANRLVHQPMRAPWRV
jgi:hypothetical protein